MKEIEIYKNPDGTSEVEVRFEGETFWLSLNQIAELFGRDKSVISRHLRNIYKEGELEERAIVAKNATVQNEAGRKVKREIEYYNLDVIISVGYRVNSKRGTQFRQWATQKLKDYLVAGAAINQKRLNQLQQTIQLITAGGTSGNLQLEEAKGLLDVIDSYNRSFELLNQYDSHNFSKEELAQNISYEIHYNEARAAIDELRRQLEKRKKPPTCLVMKKTMALKAPCKALCRHLAANICIPALKNRQPICFISLSKTIHSPMEINV